MATVIVFGPTGHVGAAVANAAHAYGASKVVLAMRDTSKPIPGLKSSAGNFQRVQADLTNPSSITAAVSSTGATRAFIYITFGSEDHMASALAALKAGGIEFVVFLSTATLGKGADLTSLNPATDIIAWAHAQVELNLISVFGRGKYVSLRPGFFATNALAWWKGMIPSGKVKVFGPEVRVDWIAQDDIGKVAAAILGAGKVREEADEEAVWLIGPQKASLREGVVAISKAVLGREAEIVVVEGEAAVQALLDAGMPPPVASHLVESFAQMEAMQERGDGKEWLPVPGTWEEAAAVVERYTGGPAMGLLEWVEKYKGAFKG